MKEGIREAWTPNFTNLKKQIDAGEVTSGDVFGPRDYLQINYLYRMGAAVVGIFGNSEDEAMYPIYKHPAFKPARLIFLLIFIEAACSSTFMSYKHEYGERKEMIFHSRNWILAEIGGNATSSDRRELTSEALEQLQKIANGTIITAEQARSEGVIPSSLQEEASPSQLATEADSLYRYVIHFDVEGIRESSDGEAGIIIGEYEHELNDAIVILTIWEIPSGNRVYDLTVQGGETYANEDEFTEEETEDDAFFVLTKSSQKIRIKTLRKTINTLRNHSNL
jgi:hypothetical protein